jgi:hypothetical protein
MSKVIEHSMKFRVVSMTPEWAQQLLNNNHPRNRKPKKHRIESYARDMKNQFWRLTPEPVCVDLDGYLTNGQNRLTAVIHAGVEVPMSLVTGCPRDSIIGQDQGATRNVGDIACISGQKLPHGDKTSPAVIRAMYAGLDRLRMTNADVLHFAFECLPNNVRGIAQAPVRAVIARAYYRRNLRSRTREFCEILLSGMPKSPKADSGAIRLRNYLQDLAGQGKRGASRVKSEVIYAKTERALKAFHDHEYVDKLIEYKREVFPLPEEGEEMEDTTADRNGVAVVQ